MTVTLNDAAITRWLQLDTGLGAVLRRVGIAVEAKARQNASGAILNIRSGDLIDGLFVRNGLDGQGQYVEVGTTAIHRGFGYPGYHDRNGRPWLRDAVRDVIGAERVSV